ncbi:phosphatase PAP2 family protein [Maribacter algarum]|uniref:Phosphatase PAP2 family protein n=1 Tax=Maribacter algarum (ex Zhang et al. 2020) TaxID=2578118 RepID=A0A5S3PSA8_9FLAO|nr:phosphatase PAP2 family protein [Maribacter algarum]TMM57519.1 phosphatase PAP2 family protein [Maribacter algarum]
MLEELFRIDEELFLHLNGMGTPLWDGFWLYISRTLSLITIPLLIMVIFLSYRFFGWRKTALIIGLAILLLGCTELLSILFKNNIARLRPCYHYEISKVMRVVKSYCGGQYGYFSAHAANSCAFACFFGILLGKKTKSFVLFIGLWALLVSYSRIYIGVHFPLDVITGIFFGIGFGYVFGNLLPKLDKYIE